MSLCIISTQFETNVYRINNYLIFSRDRGAKFKILTKESSPTVTIWAWSTYIQLILTTSAVLALNVCWLARLKIKGY